MKELYRSLANFQQEVPIIHKGNQGYGYSYADLPTIFEVINPLLKKNGLGFTQLVGSGTIKTIVFHYLSGEIIETETKIPDNVQLKGMNDFQVLGSAITYIRRYALSAILGLVTDKDTDAAGEQEKQSESKQNQEKTDNRRWLNPGTKDWNNAIEKLKNQEIDMLIVESSYRISNENKSKLIKEIQS